MRNIYKNFTFDLAWLWLCLFIVISSLFYYIYQIDLYSLILSLILSFIPIKWQLKKENSKRINFSFNNKLLFILFLIFFSISLLILFLSQTSSAIVSPWQVVPSYFFLSYFLTVFLAILFLKNYRNSIFENISLFLLFFLSFSVAVVVYKIGYGYDPFVHQASIYHILEHGYMLPKNLYYIGQYNLIITLNQFFALPISLANKIIVPLFSAIFLIYFATKFLKENLESNSEKKHISLAIILSLLLGFSVFIVSTPQNLAYVFLLATIVFNINKQVYPFALFSAMATFFIHPIAGIPAIMFTLIYLIKIFLKNNKFKKILSNLIYLSTIIVIPLSLVIGAGAGFDWQLNFNGLQFFYLNQENIILNYLYFFINNYYWFLVLLIITAVVYLRKSPYFNTLSLSLKMSLAILLATFLSFFLNWQDLISYEQSDYARRFIVIAILFLLPSLWIFFIKLINNIKKLDIKKQIIFFIFFSLLITISLYGSYPKKDNYHNSRGYSISSGDIKAVEIINDWSSLEYIVLANQQVGVTALKKYGFDNYLSSNYGPIYFYSIPTGGLLYQDYLNMVYDQASYENIKKAMDLVNVNQAFLVVNKYWWASEKIISEAKISADDYKPIKNGEIIIFKYLR